MLNANAWYGFATKELIDATVVELDQGNQDRVLASLKHLREQFHPTYENRARYDELVKVAVAEMQAPRTDVSEP
jgi:hypothetical protein